jgi:hypothetical protein
MEWEYFFDSRDYKIAAGAWFLEVLTADDATWVAATALLRGADGQAIREVAGLLDPTRREDGETICAMFEELGVKAPEPGEPIGWFIPSFLFRIRDGGERSFDRVMQDVWNQRFVDSPDSISGIGSTWRRLLDAMYKWDEMAVLTEYLDTRPGREAYEKARTSLITGVRNWVESLLTQTVVTGG